MDIVVKRPKALMMWKLKEMMSPELWLRAFTARSIAECSGPTILLLPFAEPAHWSSGKIGEKHATHPS